MGLICFIADKLPPAPMSSLRLLDGFIDMNKAVIDVCTEYQCLCTNDIMGFGEHLLRLFTTIRGTFNLLRPLLREYV